MQVKLIFEIGTLNSEYKRIETRYINDDIYPNGKLGDEVVKFLEHNAVTVTFESEDANSVLEIESYNCDGSAIVKPSESIIISSGVDEDDMMVPGYYSVIVRTIGQVYDGLYMVEPSSMSWNGVVNMRMYLENILEGLSYNLYIQRTGQQGNNILHNVFLSEIYNYIRNNANMLVNNIGSIIKSPIINVRKFYSEHNGGARRPDIRSQRWLSQKGVSLNRNLNMPDIVYEKHSDLDMVNIENKWARKIVDHTIEVLCQLEISYKNILKKVENRLEIKIEEHERENYEYKNGIANNIVLSDNYKTRKWNRIRLLHNEACELKENKEFIQGILDNIKKIRSALSHSEYETWLNDIRGFEKVVRPSSRIIKDYRYSQLYSFYIELTSMEKNSDRDKKSSFPYKKTSRLFEYYVVVLIIGMIQKEGFQWKSGWLADGKDGKLYNGELPSETVIYFTKDNLLCELAYDLEIDNKPGNKTIGRFMRNNARSCRPDIRLAIYDSETLKLLNASVIEVKCRKSKYIYSEKGDTSVIEQLNDYYNFEYKNPQAKKNSRAIINSVIVIYPKQQGKIIYNDGHNFSFIQIEPTEYEDEGYGYEELREKITELLTK